MLDDATPLGAEPEITTSQIDPVDELVEALAPEDNDDGNENGLDNDATELNDDEPEDELFTVKINGKEVQVTREELISRYQKEEASGQKFEEAARIRQEAEAERAKYTQQYQQLAEAVARIDQQAQLWAQEGQPDWEALLEENPHEYLKQQEKFKARLATLQQAQQARQHLQYQQQELQQQELQKHIEAESKKLVSELIPEWKDKEVRERDEAELIDYLTSVGYSQDDLQALNHSRASNIALARKAMLYDKAMAKIRGLKKQEPDAAKPVPTLGTKSKATRKSIDDPNLPFDDFVKLRREQIKNRR